MCRLERSKEDKEEGQGLREKLRAREEAIKEEKSLRDMKKWRKDKEGKCKIQEILKGWTPELSYRKDVGATMSLIESLVDFSRSCVGTWFLLRLLIS